MPYFVWQSLRGGLAGDRLRVHWLAHGPDRGDAIGPVGRRVARLFGTAPPPARRHAETRHG